jgi:penicillin-binding protein 1A
MTPIRSGQNRVALGILLMGGFVTMSLGAGIAVGSWTRACAGNACPSIVQLEGYRPTQAAKVYAADGRLITELGHERRTVLSFDEITPALRAAFIAVEDKRFFEHGGIDQRRIMGAIKANLLSLSYAQGFSTISMQLARNIFPDDLPSTKSIRRKVREMRVALELERTYSKDRLLELYLNQIYLGGSAYGVEAGARRYFGKSARDLNPAEAGLLAAIANVPGHYDPRRFPDRALQRRNLVLNLMRDQGYMDTEATERWKAYPILLSSREDFQDVAPYFVEWVRQQLYDRYGSKIYEKGYRIYTTLDLDMQLAAERALEDQLERVESGELGTYRHPTFQEFLEQETERSGKLRETPYLQGALVTLDAKTGYVRALVGGRNYGHSEFNRATQARRQAGSTFKPFVFTAAVRSGRPASYIVDDKPVSIMQNDTLPWEPQNFDDQYLGPMTLRRGLTLSRNLVAIRLGMELGVRTVIGEAARFGLSTPLPAFPSLYIGSADVLPIEMASAYTMFATLGSRAAPVGILRVEDADGNIVWEPQVRRDEIIDPVRGWILTSMLEDVVNRGTAYTAVRLRGGFTHPAGGKTGTTNDGTDVWFIGFTSEFVTTVWMGFDQPRKIIVNAAGGRLAAPGWVALMKEVYERREAPAGWDRPASLIAREIDNTTGLLTTAFCPRQERRWEWFIPGTEPQERCPVHNPFLRGISLAPRGSSPAAEHR